MDINTHQPNLPQGWYISTNNQEQWRTVQDLEDAIRQMELAGLKDEVERREWRSTMVDLSFLLLSRYKSTTEPGDLERAIEVADAVLDCPSTAEPDEACWLHGLALQLIRRLEKAPDPSTESKAIRFAERCVAGTDSSHPHLLSHRMLLVEVRDSHCDQTTDPAILNQAIDNVEAIQSIMPADHESSYSILCELGRLYESRFEQSHATKDIDSVVGLSRLLAETAHIDDPLRPCKFHHLSQDLYHYFKHSKNLAKLDQAIDEGSFAVSVTPEDHRHRVEHLAAQGQLLDSRFQETNRLEDINEAIDIAERVLKATPEDDPKRGHRLHQLGERLGGRFDRTGLMPDLHRAIEEIMNSIAITPTDDPDRSGPLNCLAIWFGRRFEALGATNDLEQAIKNAQEAVEITAPGHPRYGMNSNTLANLLGLRYARTRDLQVLADAIKAAEAALGECPEDSDERPCRLHGLSELLETRYQHQKSPQDLERAIEKAAISAASTPEGHPHQSIHLDGLAKLLERRFLKDSVRADLDEAINSSRRAVEAIPTNHLHAAELLGTLGMLLKRRHESLQDPNPNDFDESLSCFRRSWDCSNASPSVRIQAAKNAAELLASQLNWTESSSLLQSAVELIPLVSPRSLDHVDKQYALGELSGLASRAAAAVLNHRSCASDALKLLELGRNVIAGHLLDMRNNDIFALGELDEELAKRFVSLRDELDAVVKVGPDEKPFAWEARNRRRQQADQEFREVIEEIRTRPGFESFLQPPTAEDIRAAASQGPIVVVNASPYRCDAFIIETEQIRSLKLDGVTVDDIKTNVESLRTTRLPSVLEWSWAAIARPILTALSFDQPVLDDQWSRLWWVLTGPLGHLPMHAAGRHDQGNRETVLDRVISSYASSVKSILYDRKRGFRHAAGNTQGNAVLISMSKTPGHSELQFTAPEIAEVMRICPSLNLNAVTPVLCKDDVLGHLKLCETFHFAGHGMSDPSEPSKSSLYLDDWQSNPLTVGDLRELKLRETAPWLGYLSACSTGEIRAEKLIDETIHLVSAYQLAGFRHVVGTLWEVSDRYCVDMARAFYEGLRGRDKTDFAVARALHTAVRAIRDRSVAGGLPTPRDASTHDAMKAKLASPYGGRETLGMEPIVDGMVNALLQNLRDKTSRGAGLSTIINFATITPWLRRITLSRWFLKTLGPKATDGEGFGVVMGRVHTSCERYQDTLCRHTKMTERPSKL
ncbi:hypothetical protein INS49_005690 [Diaporthe citri]|uniref:uncharacterized protein n=1 Tax=Diaporthe citri TaxID=83186 RepID=UPI001C8164CA|nr:uncharacterized protein INS49_005690 [Diaporthe citri]KAG6364092.1 hypothetical protein INS49_005690 [Diaporthe citri]